MSIPSVVAAAIAGGHAARLVAYAMLLLLLLLLLLPLPNRPLDD